MNPRWLSHSGWTQERGPTTWISFKGNGYLFRWREGGRKSAVKSRYAPTLKDAERLKDVLDQEGLARRVRGTPKPAPWHIDLGPVSAVE